MSDDVFGPRPRQVTMGGLFATVAGVLVILTCYQSLENLHSVDVRTNIEDYLSSGLGKSLSMSVAEVQTVMRVALMVAAAAAAVAGVLGIYVLQRQKGARNGLSVVAVVLLVTAPISGGIGLFVVVGAVLLWTAPARDWFAGRPPRERLAPPQKQDLPPPSGPSLRDVPPPANPASIPAPVPMPGFYDRPPGADPRPSTVVIAAALTWIFAGVTLVAVTLLMVVLASNSKSILDAADKNSRVQAAGLSHSTILAGLWVVCLLLALLAVAGCVFAYLVYQRHAWARVALIATIVIGLVLSMGSLPISVVHVVAMLVSAVLLVRTPTNDWLRGR